MKHQSGKRLALNRQTMKLLSGDELYGVVGGATGSLDFTICDCKSNICVTYLCSRTNCTTCCQL